MRIRSISAKKTCKFIVALLLSICMTSPALAATPQSDDEIAAEILFNEGNALVAKGEYAAAIPKFQASEKAAHANGTLFNLANAYEQTGRLATAWKTFMRIVNDPSNGPPTPRQQEAEKRADALKPRLPRLTVVIPESLAKTPDLKVFIDDEILIKDLWNSSVPVDPGIRKVTVEAPGKTSWSSKTRELKEKDSARMEVPDVLIETEFPKQRIVALTIGGLGAAAGIAAIVTGSLAKSTSNQAHDACGDNCVTGSPQWFFGNSVGHPPTLMKSALEYEKAAITLSVVSGVALGTGAILWFTAKGKPQKDSALLFVPTISSDYAGGVLHFKF